MYLGAESVAVGQMIPKPHEVLGSIHSTTYTRYEHTQMKRTNPKGRRKWKVMCASPGTASKHSECYLLEFHMIGSFTGKVFPCGEDLSSPHCWMSWLLDTFVSFSKEHWSSLFGSFVSLKILTNVTLLILWAATMSPTHFCRWQGKEVKAKSHGSQDSVISEGRWQRKDRFTQS